MPKDVDEKIEDTVAKLGIGRYHRHVFMCTGPKCCTPEQGAESWELLKKEMKDRGLSLTMGPNECYRTKVGCLRVCAHGPVMVVYPEGTWYRGMTADRIPLFVTQHLEKGEPVKEWIFAENPLPHE